MSNVDEYKRGYRDGYDSGRANTITNLIQEAHETAKSKGWWEEKECPCVYITDEEASWNDFSCHVCKGTGTIPPRTFGDQIALMHSELSEALEEFRNDRQMDYIYSVVNDLVEPYQKGMKPEGIAVELADVLIRIFDTCGYYGIPLEYALKLKMEYNKTRPHRHGGKVL